MTQSSSATNQSVDLSLYQPTAAYIGASWASLLIGSLGFLVGLWNAEMILNEKGYFLAVLALGLYAAISIQKTVRDKAEGIPTSTLYFNISWAALALSVLLLVVGLWQTHLSLSERGFYLMSFTLASFAAITIQKNTRDQVRLQAMASSTVPVSSYSLKKSDDIVFDNDMDEE